MFLGIFDTNIEFFLFIIDLWAGLATRMKNKNSSVTIVTIEFACRDGG